MAEVVLSFQVKQELIPDYKVWVGKNAARIAENSLPGLRYIGTWITKIGSSNEVERRFSIENFEALKILVEGQRSESQQKLISEERAFISGSLFSKVLAKVC